MSEHSKIEWTDATWNPIRGCTKVSPGCAHCYAQTFAERFRGVRGHPYERGFDPRLVPEKLGDPFKWNTRKMVFVNSMSDLFLEMVPDNYIEAVIEVMRCTPWHTYQVLTKRSGRLKTLLNSKLKEACSLPNVWWGVSVEDCKFGLPRIADLRSTPVAVRFISIEPMLEDLGDLDLTGIHWVIVGGESGPKSRPMDKQWVRAVLSQCRKADALFFFKQWGGVHKATAGRKLDGKKYNETPAVPDCKIPDRNERQRLLKELEAKYAGKFKK